MGSLAIRIWHFKQKGFSSQSLSRCTQWSHLEQLALEIAFEELPRLHVEAEYTRVFLLAMRRRRNEALPLCLWMHQAQEGLTPVMGTSVPLPRSSTQIRSYCPEVLIQLEPSPSCQLHFGHEKQSGFSHSAVPSARLP